MVNGVVDKEIETRYHEEGRQMDGKSVWRSFKSEKNGKKFELLPAIIEKNME